MMGIYRTLLTALMLFFALSAQADEEVVYKPFILAEVTSGSTAAMQVQVEKKLRDAGFEVVGTYSPYEGSVVIGITNAALKKNAAASEFGGYGVVQRVSITSVGNDVQIAYTNPVYMANAYRMKGDLADVAATLKKVLGSKEAFGSEEGMTARKLRKYHYLFGMEYFDDVEAHRLMDHISHQKAVDTVEENLAKGLGGVTKVWRVDIPGKEEVVFGVGMKMPPDGDKNMDDKYLMGEIDFKDLKSTAHLPYEILVSGKSVYALYARFRIAIDFPDLSMMGDNSFMTIMESPEALKKALTRVAGGEIKKEYWQ